jgi:hypothetical protein
VVVIEKIKDMQHCLFSLGEEERRIGGEAE